MPPRRGAPPDPPFFRRLGKWLRTTSLGRDTLWALALGVAATLAACLFIQVPFTHCEPLHFQWAFVFAGAVLIRRRFLVFLLTLWTALASMTPLYVGSQLSLDDLQILAFPLGLLMLAFAFLRLVHRRLLLPVASLAGYAAGWMGAVLLIALMYFALFWICDVTNGESIWPHPILMLWMAFNGAYVAIGSAVIVTVARAFERLAEGSRRMTTILDAMGEAVVLTDGQGRIGWMNPMAQTLLGLPESQTRGAPIQDVVAWQPPLGEAAPGNPVAAALDHRADDRSIALARMTDGRQTPRQVAFSAAPVFSPEGACETFVFVMRDITLDYQAREALVESESRFRLLVEHAPDAIYVQTGGQFVFLNPAALQLFGAPSAQSLLGQPVIERFAPEDHDLVKARIHRLLVDKLPVPRIEQTCLTLDGRTVDVEASAVPTYYEGHDGALVFVRDITERRRDRQALRQAEERLRVFIGNVADMIYFQPRQGARFFYNNACHAITGYSKDDFEADPGLWDSLLHPTDLQEIRRVLAEAPDGAETGDILYRIRRADRRWGWVHSRLAAARNDLGELLGYYCIDRDVTEQKEHENLLRFQSLVLDQIGDLVLATDLEGRITYANAAESRLFGLPRSELLGRSVEDFGTSRQEVLAQQAILERAQEDGFWRGELVNYDAGGHRHILDSRVWLLRDEQGAPIGLCGCATDVSAHKAAEIALRESEARYRLFLDSTTDLAFIKDATLRYILVNQANLDYMGLSEADILGKNDFEVMSRKAAEYCRQSDWQALIQGRLTVSLEQVGDRIFEARKFPIHLGDGTIGVGGFLRDITERKQAEDRLARSEAFFHSLVENLPQCILRKDTEGRFTFANSRFCQVLGRQVEEILGKTDYDFYPVDLATKYREDDMAVMTMGQMVETIDEHITGAGEMRHVQVIKSPILNREGVILGTQCIFWDITDRRRAEEERIRMERQIQQTQKLESLGVLAGGIAHDFNNILMAILGHAELALDEMSPLSPARHSLRQIETAARRAADLCRQMLAYSGKAPFTMEPLDLRELIEEMAHLLKTSISKKAILNLHLQQDMPSILADASQVRQVVLNLIINASEAIGERSGVITITAGATRCDSAYLTETCLDNDLAPGLYVYVEVADTGCGMDAETRARIFEPFFTTKFTGRGLGMAAVLGIVRAHKGALKLYSEPGRGTTFKVLFPARPTQSLPAEAADGADAAWTGQGVILLVDDEEVLLTLGAQMLRKLGFEVWTAPDGREAVQLFRDRHSEIDLVFMDLTMPHMDGAEAFREMRRIDPEARIILASGYSAQDAASRFAGKGLAGFIQKPYNLAQLRGMIATTLDATDQRDNTDPGTPNAPRK